MKRKIDDSDQAESAKKKIKTEALKDFVYDNNLAAVKALLEDPHFVLDATQSQRLLLIACTLGYIDLVRVLLIDQRFREDINLSQLINIACEKGYILIVERLINDPLDIDDISYGFIMACKNGHFNIVKLLLERNLVSPAYGKNAAIEWAASRGHYQILDYLIQFSEVNPADRNNIALKMATDKGFLNEGQEACAIRLLQDPRVQADNSVFCDACKYNMHQLLQILLNKEQDFQIDSFLIHNMVNRCSFQSLKVLLDSPKVKEEVKVQIRNSLAQIQEKFYKQASFLFFARMHREQDTSLFSNLPDEIIENIAQAYIKSI